MWPEILSSQTSLQSRRLTVGRGGVSTAREMGRGRGDTRHLTGKVQQAWSLHRRPGSFGAATWWRRNALQGPRKHGSLHLQSQRFECRFQTVIKNWMRSSHCFLGYYSTFGAQTRARPPVMLKSDLNTWATYFGIAVISLPDRV